MEEKVIDVKIPNWVLEDCGGISVSQIIKSGQLELIPEKIKKTNLGNRSFKKKQENSYLINGWIKSILFYKNIKKQAPKLAIIDCGIPLRLMLKEEDSKLFNVNGYKEETFECEGHIFFYTCVDGEFLRKPIDAEILEIRLIGSEETRKVKEIKNPFAVEDKEILVKIRIKDIHKIESDVEGRNNYKVLIF